MKKLIDNIPDPAVLTAFTAAVNTALTPLNPFKIHFTNDEKRGARSMSEGREGYVRLISRVANQFPDSLSRSDVSTDLSNLLDYYDGLEANRIALLQAIETINDIQLAGATDIMVLVDRYAASLQLSRGHEGTLNLAMKDVDDWNKRYVNVSKKAQSETLSVTDQEK
jgi:hypothetical protein